MDFLDDNRKIKYNLVALILLLMAVFLAAFVISCSSGPQKSLSTPEGVVNTFLSRVLDDGDLKGAFELLSTPDQNVIAQNQEAYDFIMGKTDPQYEAYIDVYSQLAPDLRGMIKKLVKFNARKGKERDGVMEVGLEISYPSDYMTLGIMLMGIGTRLQQKYDMVKIDSIPKEERDKIIWSIKNDLNNAVNQLNVEKRSTYIFPVKMVKEDGKWKINLDLERRQSGLGM